MTSGEAGEGSALCRHSLHCAGTGLASSFQMKKQNTGRERSRRVKGVEYVVTEGDDSGQGAQGHTQMTYGRIAHLKLR